MPSTTIPKMTANAMPKFVDRMQAGAATPLAIPGGLLRLLAAADVTSPGDVDRLTEQQLARVLENKTPGERIGIKQAVVDAGIAPRSMVIGTSIGWPTIR